jgi:hypothetical protein
MFRRLGEAEKGARLNVNFLYTHPTSDSRVKVRPLPTLHSVLPCKEGNADDGGSVCFVGARGAAAGRVRGARGGPVRRRRRRVRELQGDGRDGQGRWRRGVWVVSWCCGGGIERTEECLDV